MAETTKVRIGLEGARELEFDVDDPGEVRTAVAAALADGESVVSITDARGNEYNLVVAKIAFFEIEASDPRGGVGFNLGSANAAAG